MTPPQHITFQAEKKRLSPKKMAESFFFGTETKSKKFTGGVVRDNLVPPVYVMSPTEEIMTQPKENERVKKSKAGSLKIGTESFCKLAES